MKKYLAIGHWDDSKNTTCVASTAHTMNDFRDDLGGNGFVPYVILSEKKLKEIEKAKDMELFYIVKKLTSNYRKWNEICEYINQCWEIMEEKLARA